MLQLNEADDEVKDDFYEQLQKIVDEVPRHDMLLVVGHCNAKLGEQQLGEEGTVEKFGMTGERSDNGERFVSFCALNNLAIASAMFPHKAIQRYTWTSPNGQCHNHMDHVASDHILVMAKTLLKLDRTGMRTVQLRRYETGKLNVPEIRKQYQLNLRTGSAVYC